MKRIHYYLSVFLQARALYDFEGDIQNGELGFTTGEQLTIVRQVCQSNLDVPSSKIIVALVSWL